MSRAFLKVETHLTNQEDCFTILQVRSRTLDQAISTDQAIRLSGYQAISTIMFNNATIAVVRFA